VLAFTFVYLALMVERMAIERQKQQHVLALRNVSAQRSGELA
jgi:hypothetical protein